MGTVTIYPPVEIPDNPEFCEWENKRCKSANLWDVLRCASFLETAIFKDENGTLVKCTQCKELYQKQLNKKP